MTPVKSSWNIPWHLMLIFSLLCGGILALGYVYYRHQEEHFHREVEAQLGAIANLKVKQAVAWRQERMHDALLTFDDPIFAAEVLGWFTGKEADGQREEILHRLAGLKQDLYEGIALFDARGDVRLSIPELKPELLSLAKATVLEAVRGQEVVFTDFYQVPGSGAINLSLAVPIHFHEGDERIDAGVVLLQVNPHDHFFPLIQTWPAPTRTAEIMLARREGNDLVCLTEVRHASPGAAERMRLCLTGSDDPVIKSVRTHSGVFTGPDYRGVSVMAATESIPDSPWFLTAKIDLSEVNAPLRGWFKLIALFTTTLFAIAGLIIALIWRSRDVQFFARQYEAESEKRAMSQRYEYLAKHANDIILILDRNWKIIEANDRAVVAYGYAREQLLDLHLRDLDEHGPPAATERVTPGQESGEEPSFEALHRRKNGTTFPVEISSSLMEIGGDIFYQQIIRDVTERKRREDALRESERQLRFLSSQLIIVQENEREKISKELHDEMGQALMILKYQLNAIQSKLSRRQKALKDDCGFSLGYLDNVIENIRRLCRHLSPTVLERLGFAAALKRLLEEFGKHLEIQWDPGAMQETDKLFSRLAQINIYRIFQESLTNIGRHSGATRVVIGMEKTDDRVCFTIEDDGKGFDPLAPSTGEARDRGIGLAAMQERARIAGGSLEIWSRPGGGARISFTIPVDKGV